MPDEPLVSAAEIARLAGVGRAAVSNWRRRHADFPQPVAAGKFRFSDVEGWLEAQGKLSETDPYDELWQALATGADIVQRVADVATLLAELDAAAEFSALIELAEAAEIRLHPRVEAALIKVGDPPAVIVECLVGRLFTGHRQHLCTRPELATLLVELGELGGRWTTILDPACGPGTVLVTARQLGRKVVSGREIDPALAQLAQARVTLSAGIRQSDGIATGDSLRSNDYNDSEYDVGGADLVVCEPPFGYRDWGYEDLTMDPRWIYGVPVKSEPELAWVQHCLASTRPDGQVIIILPASVAARRAGRSIRAAMVRNGVFRAVIALPQGALRSTGTPVHIWLLRNPRVHGAKKIDPVLLIDHTDVRLAKRSDLDWPTITEAVLAAWKEFAATGQVRTIPGRQHVIEAIDLLDENVDLTPATHIPPQASTVDIEALAKHRAELIADLRALTDLLPEVPQPANQHHPRRTIADLAKAGAIALHQQSLAKLDLTETGTGQHVLTGRDVATRCEASLRLPVPTTDLITLGPGDLVIPQLTDGTTRPTPLILTKAHEGLVLGPNLYLIRVNPDYLDAHYLAGHLTATAPTSITTSGVHRLDVRRVSIPVPDLGTQRHQGAQFRRLIQFRTRLHALTATADEVVNQLATAIATGTNP